MSTTNATGESSKKKAKIDNANDNDKKAALFQGDDLWDPKWQEAAGEETLRKRMKCSRDDAKFILYGSWFCPFAQRAWIAAEHSGVPYHMEEINPYYVDPNKPGGYTKLAMKLEEKQEKNPDFIDASPRGLVPAIRVPKSASSNISNSNDDDAVLWESLPVAEFIDAVFGGKKLLDRSDPYQVAKQQIWCDHCTNRIQKKYYQALVAQEKSVQEDCIEEFYKECRSLARAMCKDGPYFDGSDLSMVDVALAPFWQRIITVGPHFFGLTLPKDEPEFQRLEKWWQACHNHPSISATIVSEPRLVSTYSDYSRNEATSDAAKNYFK